jgi:hypothetical protein
MKSIKLVLVAAIAVASTLFSGCAVTISPLGASATVGVRTNTNQNPCDPGDSLVGYDQYGLPRCMRNNNQQRFQGNAVCGQAAMYMQCPSVAISGTNCRRCQ